MCEPITDRSCHLRHTAAARVVVEFLEQKGKRGDAEITNYLGALAKATSTDWEDLSCGHFARWLWQQLLNHFGDLAENTDTRVLENSISSWYDLSCQMITPPSYLHDPRRERVDTNHWIDEFKDHVSNAGSPVPETLLKTFERHAMVFTKPNIHMLHECLASVASLVIARRPDLRIRFLHAAINSVSRVHDLGWRLLDDVLNVVEQDPESLIPLLIRYVQTMGSQYVDGLFKSVHERVTSWVDGRTEPKKEARLKKQLKHLIPFLLGHDFREPRRSALGPNSVEALVTFVGEPSGDEVIKGTVRDVSGGIDDGLGRGIHVYAEGWTFRLADDPPPEIPRTVIAKGPNRKVEQRFQQATVRLTYNEPRCESNFNAYCVRGFEYKPQYRLTGGGLVLFLDDSSEDFPDWRKFVDQLGEVKFEVR